MGVLDGTSEGTSDGSALGDWVGTSVGTGLTKLLEAVPMIKLFQKAMSSSGGA